MGLIQNWRACIFLMLKIKCVAFLLFIFVFRKLLLVVFFFWP